MLRSRPLVVTSVLLGLIIPLLLLAGLSIHNIMADSLSHSHVIRTARADVSAALIDQVDEETGVRGFVATKQALYLEPYEEARQKLGPVLDRLRAEIEEIRGAGRVRLALDVDSAIDINRSWISTVAEPLRAEPARADDDRLEAEGKRLVDTFRARMAAVDAQLDQAQQDGDSRLASEIDLIEIVVAVASLVLLGAGTLYLFDQQRLNKRLEQERSVAEIERRAAAEMRAAYETEKRIADTLQEGFSQRPLPVLPTVHFSASYIPATEETRVGGDWYDAVELSESRVLFTIGDVAGHGLDAAVTMNRARQAVLGSALRDADPSEILARINADFVRQGAPMVTAIVGIADSKTYEFTFATAGHPPPVLVEPGRAPRMLDVGGLPLGVMSNAKYRTTTVQSFPGAVLVLYTDGAVEHSHDVLAGERLLLDAAATVFNVDERDAATSIHRAIFDDRSVGDDVAILTVGFAGDRAPGLLISAEGAQATISGRIARGPSDLTSPVSRLRAIRRAA